MNETERVQGQSVDEWLAEYDKATELQKTEEKENMAIMAKSEGGNFEQPDTGPWPARCYSIIDLGHQRGEWQGEEKIRYQVLVIWELPTQDALEDGRPRSISKFYTLSLHEKSNLGKDLVAWRGKAFTEEEKLGFDISKLAGVPCMLNLVEKKDRVRVDGVMPLPKGTPIPDQKNDTLVFELQAYIDGDTSVYDKLSEGLQKLVNKAMELEKGTIEYSMAHGGTPKDVDNSLPDDFEDSIPF